MHKFKPVALPVIVALIVVAGVGFYGGMRYGSSQSGVGDNRSFGVGSGARRGTGAGRTQGNFAAGDVIAKDDKSITVSMRSGGSKIIFFSDATQVMKSAPGALIDIMVGQQITAMGTQNSDGSMTAQSIQIRPAMPKTTP